MFLNEQIEPIVHGLLIDWNAESDDNSMGGEVIGYDSTITKNDKHGWHVGRWAKFADVTHGFAYG